MMLTPAAAAATAGAAPLASISSTVLDGSLWLSIPLAALAGLGLDLRGPELLVPITTAALPTAQNVFMYASRYGAAKPLARDAVLITTAGFVPIVLIAAAALG